MNRAIVNRLLTIQKLVLEATSLQELDKLGAELETIEKILEN